MRRPRTRPERLTMVVDREKVHAVTRQCIRTKERVPQGCRRRTVDVAAPRSVRLLEEAGRGRADEKDAVSGFGDSSLRQNSDLRILLLHAPKPSGGVAGSIHANPAASTTPHRTS